MEVLKDFSDNGFPVYPDYIKENDGKGTFSRPPSEAITEEEFNKKLRETFLTSLEWGQRGEKNEKGGYLYPFSPNNATTVRRILERDAYCRKVKNWPLIPLSDYPNYKTVSSELSYIPFEDDLFVAGKSDLFVAGKSDLHDRFDINEPKEVIERLYINYSCLENLMIAHSGKIAVCGGALTRLCTHNVDISDVDIFFYNIESEEEANGILLNCISLIIKQVAKEARGEYESKRMVRVEHRLYITNVLIYDYDESYPIETYQFIHRIYPRLDLIIGGFDLGPSSLAFDGNQIYGTELAIFSIAKKCLIVDTTRRSLSFEHRIIKMRRLGFNIVFPGLNDKKTTEILNKPNRFQVEDRTRKIYVLMKKLGLDMTSLRKVLIPGQSLQDLEDFRLNQRVDIHLPYVKTIKTIQPTINIGDLELESHNLSSNRNEYRSVSEAKNIINDHEETPKKILSKYSDYYDYSLDIKEKLPLINSNCLRLNNIEGVISYVEFIEFGEDDSGRDVFDEEEIGSELLKLFYDPVVKFDENYKERAYDYLIKRENEMNLRREEENKNRHTITEDENGDEKLVSYVNRFSRDTRKEVQLFAEFLPKIRKLQREFPQEAPKYICQVIEFLNKRMFDNAKIIKEQLTGIKWITQDPQRQWTSSINPIVENPKDFYGEYYTPFYLFMPAEVEGTLRLIRRRHRENKDQDSVFGLSMPPDVFRLILSYVARAYIYNFSWFDEYKKIFTPEAQPKPPVITQVDLAKERLRDHLNKTSMKSGYYKSITPVSSNIEAGYIFEEVARMQKLETIGYISKNNVDNHLAMLPKSLRDHYNRGLKDQKKDGYDSSVFPITITPQIALSNILEQTNGPLISSSHKPYHPVFESLPVVTIVKDSPTSDSPTLDPVMTKLLEFLQQHTVNKK